MLWRIPFTTSSHSSERAFRPAVRLPGYVGKEHGRAGTLSFGFCMCATARKAGRQMITMDHRVRNVATDRNPLPLRLQQRQALPVRDGRRHCGGSTVRVIGTP